VTKHDVGTRWAISRNGPCTLRSAELTATKEVFNSTKLSYFNVNLLRKHPQKETPGVAIKSALPEAIVQPNRQAKNRDLLLGSIFTAQKMETNRYSTLASSASKPSAAAAQKVEISIPFEGEKALRIQHQRRQEQERRLRLHLEIMVRDQSSSAVTSLMRQFDDKFSSMTPLERRQFVEAKMNIADHIYC